MTNERTIEYFNFLVKEYAGVTNLIAQTRQRLQSLPGEERDPEFDTLLKGQDKMEGLETVKGRISRELEKELKNWDIWEMWAKKIPGIGPAIAGQLIILFYYRFVAICKDCGGDLLKSKPKKNGGDEEESKAKGTLVCKDCGKKANKEGLLKYRVEEKDFPTISKWWAYMGRHTVDGKMPKRKAGVVSNWSTVGRTLGFHIGDQFNRQKGSHPYRALLDQRKDKRAKNCPDWKKGHIHNASKNEVVKIFLAHWWTVARTLQGKVVSEPYAGALLGHTNIIKPFYWESDDTVETHAVNASEHHGETHPAIASR